MDKDGILHTIDNNKELVEIQNKYFKKANLKDKIVQHSGDAKNIIPQLMKNLILFLLMQIGKLS